MQWQVLCSERKQLCLANENKKNKLFVLKKMSNQETQNTVDKMLYFLAGNTYL